MKKVLPVIVLFAITTLSFGQSAVVTTFSKQSTICNPLNLSYRFCLNDPSRREAADPEMILFKGEYYLFLDDDGRLYFYYGGSNTKPLYGNELDV